MGNIFFIEEISLHKNILNPPTISYLLNIYSWPPWSNHQFWLLISFIKLVIFQHPITRSMAYSGIPRNLRSSSAATAKTSLTRTTQFASHNTWQTFSSTKLKKVFTCFRRKKWSMITWSTSTLRSIQRGSIRRVPFASLNKCTYLNEEKCCTFRKDENSIYSKRYFLSLRFWIIKGRGFLWCFFFY